MRDNSARPILGAVSAVGQNIKALRLNRPGGKWNQTDLAAAAGVPQSTISEWERGRRSNPDLKNLLKIASALEVSIERLVVGADERYDKLNQADLLGPTGRLKPGGATLTPETRLLEAQRAKDAQMLDDIAKAAGRIAGMVASLHESPAFGHVPASRSKGARKVR